MLVVSLFYLGLWIFGITFLSISAILLHSNRNQPSEKTLLTYLDRINFFPIQLLYSVFAKGSEQVDTINFLSNAPITKVILHFLISFVFLLVATVMVTTQPVSIQKINLSPMTYRVNEPYIVESMPHNGHFM